MHNGHLITDTAMRDDALGGHVRVKRPARQDCETRCHRNFKFMKVHEELCSFTISFIQAND